MELAKLKIQVEKEGSKLVFDGGEIITVLFNPSKLTFNRSVSWKKASASQRDVPELQYTNAQPRTLSVDLIFDTYDDSNRKRKDGEKLDKDVRKQTDKLLHLTTVEKHGDKHRPPVCRLAWGLKTVFFQGVLEKLTQEFTLFTEEGTPVRGTCRCTFKEWRTNYEGLSIENRQSSDLAKMRVLKRGETLFSIAAEEYSDPGLWRPIADENGIDDPWALDPGTVLLIPTLTVQQRWSR